MELAKKVADYLRKRFDPAACLISMENVGSGLHGTAFRVAFSVSGIKKTVMMKTLFPSRFGHDHYADRAQVLLLANANYNEMPKHVKSVDIAGDSEGGLISVGDAREFYIFMEEAEGEPYFTALDEILKRGRLTKSDKDMAAMLASFLASIHKVRYGGLDSDVLYRRRIRDLIGHGECIMGVIDGFDTGSFSSAEELMDYASECLPWWGKIRDKNERLASVHGDFHPGNIRLMGDDFMLLDRSRGAWGEPADDVSCLSINYLRYAVKERGGFDGPFADLFRLFWDKYMAETGDREIFNVVQPFFAFRALVITNPFFYADDSNEVRRRLLNFGRAVLKKTGFRIDRIPEYLGAP
jgi:aminoglycoside phosphotransferase family enzyme